MPASWGSNATEYGQAAFALASSGYEVISYAQRGFPPSTGQVDFAAAKTQQDARTVLDWTLAHTPADPSRIGMAGVSYGGGISLLSAEHDPRVKAVVAMSTWTDLAAAFVPNGTVASGAVRSLISPNSSGTFAGELSAAAATLDAGNGAATAALARDPQRSPITDVGALAHTAVLIANNAQDSIVPPNQLVTFFDKLSGPKRLRLDVGDHGSSEAAGLLSAQAAREGVWKDAMDWLDHYVRGTSNGVQDAAPVQLRDSVTKQWHDFSGWSAVGRAVTSYLDATATGTGTIGASAAVWTRTLVAGTPTVADSGPAQIANPFYVSPTTSGLGTIAAKAGVVLSGRPLPTAVRVSGIPSVHLQVAGSAGAATVYVYLYDVNGAGKATLMTYAPYTTTGAARGVAVSATVPLRPVEWTVEAGHHVAVVLDTVDSRYLSSAPAGSTVTVGSTGAAPGTLLLPLAG